MTVTLTPYGNALYGTGNYGGVTVGGFGGFDQPANRSASDTGSPAAALYADGSPVKA